MNRTSLYDFPSHIDAWVLNKHMLHRDTGQRLIFALKPEEQVKGFERIKEQGKNMILGCTMGHCGMQKLKKFKL